MTMGVIVKRQKSKMSLRRKVLYKRGLPEELCEMISKYPQTLKINPQGEKEKPKEKRLNKDGDVYDWYWNDTAEPGSLGDLNEIIEDSDEGLETILINEMDYRSVGLRILDKDINIEYKDETGGTLLMNAVFNSDIKLTRKLLDKGARTDTVDYEKTTALMWSIDAMVLNDDSYDLVELMIEKSDKITINRKDIEGKDALDRLICNYEEGKKKQYKRLIKKLVKKA
jgi:hypothetical protein